MSRVLQGVIEDLSFREKLGKQKYGETLDREDLNEAQLEQHMYEELLDACMYYKAKIMRRQRTDIKLNGCTTQEKAHQIAKRQILEEALKGYTGPWRLFFVIASTRESYDRWLMENAQDLPGNLNVIRGDMQKMTGHRAFCYAYADREVRDDKLSLFLLAAEGVPYEGVASLRPL